jgi:hypothetical protein
MRDHLAEIRHGLVQAVHPTALLLRVALLQVAVHLVDLHLHHQDHLVRNQLAQIVNVAVKIFRRAVDHPIVVVQRVRYLKDVKPVIHGGFVPSR